MFVFRTLWPLIIDWSTKLSQGTDYLRIDYFINTQTKEIVASEMNTFPWPESQFFGEFIEVKKKVYLKALSEIDIWYRPLYNILYWIFVQQITFINLNCICKSYNLSSIAMFQ